MISSIFKNSNLKAAATSRGSGFGMSQNLRSPAKKPLAHFSSSSYIDLGWISSSIEKLERFNNVGTIAYQAVALSLLTLGLILAFQSFSSLKNSENVVVLNKAQIAKIEEKRIWTDTASIDKTQIKYNFDISAAPVIQIAAINSECEKVALDSGTQFSSDQVDKCVSKADNKTSVAPSPKKSSQTKIPTKTIKVEAGENLSYLAMTNKVSVAQIVDLNDLKSNNLKLGQALIIPIGK